MQERLEHVKEIVTNNAPTVIYANGAATVGFSFVDFMTSLQTYAWAITLFICVVTFAFTHYFKWREDRRKEVEHKIRVAEVLNQFNISADGPITKEYIKKIANLDDLELKLNSNTEKPDKK